MTFAIISGECTPATPEDTISNQLISRPHELQLFSSPLSHSGAPIVPGGIPSSDSIRRTSSSLVSHL
jgi:hypothetical protein